MTVLLIIGFVGLGVLLGSLVLGDLLDGALDGLSGGLEIFSTAVIGAFESAFGFGGAIAQGAGAPGLLTVPVGLASGALFAWIAARFTRLVKGGGSDDAPTADDLLGRDATVLTAIPAGGFGTVRIRLGGHVVRVNARSEQPVVSGTQVHVTSILSPTAVTVAPVWGELPTPADPPTENQD